MKRKRYTEEKISFRLQLVSPNNSQQELGKAI